MKLKFALLLLPLLLSACAGPRYTIQPALKPGQTAAPVPGGQACAKCGKVHKGQPNHPLQSIPVVESRKQHTVTVRQLQAEVKQNERPEFVVRVENHGTAPLDFSLANIEVWHNGNLSKTYALEELMAEREAAAAAEAAAAQGVAMGMAMSAQMNANFAQMSLNNALRPGAGANYQLQQLNAAKSYVNQGMMQDSMARQYSINAALAAPQFSGLQGVLRPVSIKPGQTEGGLVVTDYIRTPGSHTLRLKVDAAGEPHEFEFEVREKVKK